MADTDLEHFELRTERTGTVLPFEGTLSTWTGEHEHRVNEHAILGSAGAIHQSNAQGPGRYTFQLVILDDDRGAASDKYAAAEATLAADPFCALNHPRLGRRAVIFNGLKITDDQDGQINGLTAELKVTETGLREVQPQVAAITARAAVGAGATLLGRLSTLVGRINNLTPPSISDLTALSPLQDVPGPVTAILAQAAHLYSAVNAFTALTDDPATDQYTLAEQLVQVGLASEAFAAAAGTALGSGPVAAYPLISQTRMAYGQALAAYQLAARGAVPIVPRRVPGRMSLARWCASLYGGGARALEEEIRRLNKGRIPNPYALLPGVDYLIPDPSRVRLDDGTSGPGRVS